MPETKRKTQAEKAADAKGKKGKAASGKKPQEPVQADKSTKVPPRVLSSILFLSLFVLLVVILIKPEGKLLVLLSTFIYGVLGRICFVVCIPVTLYLFCVHAFSGKRPVCMRTVSLLLFAFGLSPPTIIV